MRRTTTGRIQAIAFRSAVFGAMAILALGLTSIASAGALLEICTGAAPPCTLANSTGFPLVPPNPPAAGNGLTINSNESPPADATKQIPLGTRGYANSYLFLVTGSLTFTMLGHGDAIFNNEFQLSVNGVQQIDWFTGGATPTPIGTVKNVSAPANTLLDFRFISPNGSAINDGIHNPAGTGILADVNYFLSLDQSLAQPNQGLSGFIGFSDGGTGGAPQCAVGDCDFQDMVIGVRVPEPATLLLLGFGLAGLGVMGWRRKPR